MASDTAPQAQRPLSAEDEKFLLLQRYNAWLHFERRRLLYEIYPKSFRDMENWIPVSAMVFSREGSASDRAATVLAAAGVPTHAADDPRHSLSWTEHDRPVDYKLVALAEAFDAAVDGRDHAAMKEIADRAHKLQPHSLAGLGALAAIAGHYSAFETEKRFEPAHNMADLLVSETLELREWLAGAEGAEDDPFFAALERLEDAQERSDRAPNNQDADRAAAAAEIALATTRPTTLGGIIAMARHFAESPDLDGRLMEPYDPEKPEKPMCNEVLESIAVALLNLFNGGAPSLVQEAA